MCAGSPDFSLDASNKPNEQNLLIIWQAHGNENQQWEFVPAQNNTFSIRSAKNGGTLEIPDHSNAKPATQLHVSQPNGTINEMWRIVPAEGQSAGQGFAIESAACQGMVLDVRGGNMANNSDVIIYNNNHQMNQTWAIKPVQ